MYQIILKMNKLLQTLLYLLIFVTTASATKIKGHVYDQKTGEPIVGASVRIEKTNKGTSTGLDGSFEIKDVERGVLTLRVSYVSYKTVIKEIEIAKEDNPKLVIYLEPAGKDLQEVTVVSQKNGSTEREARRIEQQSVQVMNIVSGRAIEVSPDLTVANVIQRVSGVSVERNSNGDAQYAIIRGMDKRYNYTLVNGVKIPSPDNQYRYVPLDIFPSDILERLEVSKSLTPNMEADAVGGVVNMVMKNAPDRLQVIGNFSTGYNQLFLDRKFMSFDQSSINHKTPYELNGRAYQATPNDFGKGVFDYNLKVPPPNLLGSLSIGQRFLKNKLGVIVAGSYQNTYRGSNSTFYNVSTSVISDTNPFASIVNRGDRQFSDHQKRYALHGKVDYLFNNNNKISLYNVYVRLDNAQVRDAVTTNFNNSIYNPQAGNAELTYTTRSRLTEQQIYNTTLHGDHNLFNNKFKIQWSGVYSTAKNDVPDNTLISLNGLRTNFAESRTVLVNTAPVTRRWQRNTDEDKAGYLDLTYKANIGGTNVDFSTGGLYRDKQRSNFFNNYTFAAVNATTSYADYSGNYTNIALSVTNPAGGVANSQTYEAYEKVGAGYGMVKFNVQNLEVVGGARVERTDQGYQMLFPAGELRPTGKQVYTDVLPSLTLKYKLDNKQQLHGAYFKGLNRPGFFELVPGGAINEDYVERGNPDLKRSLADNYDLRYELFPSASEQLLVGAFYKKIKDPIEFTFQADATRGQDIYYTPGNFGTARNYGAELDYMKFFNKIGVKANYTYTHSRITTPKTMRRLNSTTGQIEPYLVDQTRPLYGQSEHVANVSLLYKDTKKGWDAQIAAAYTGERINTISQFLNNDLWQKGFVQMDASAEKRFKHGVTLFIKAGNLLNTPAKLFVKGTNAADKNIADDVVSNGQTLIRSDYYKQSYLIGIRYKL